MNSPFRRFLLVNNPVLKRELLTLLRRRSSFFYFLVFLLVLWFVMHEFWTEDEAISSRKIRETFLLLTFFQSGCLLFIVPIISATSINIEFERDTWDLLRTTHLHSIGIFAGKLISSIAFVLLLIVSTVPFYSILMMHGGISPNEFFIIHLMMLEGVILTGLIGLACSTWFRHPVTAITAAYAASFCYVGGTFLASVIYSEYFRQPLVGGALMLVSPLYPVITVIGRSAPSQVLSSRLQLHENEIHLVFVLILFVLLFGACLWKAGRQTPSYAVSEKSRLIRSHGLRAIFRRRKLESDSEWLSLPDRVNPVYCREYRTTEHYRRLYHYGIILMLLLLGIGVSGNQMLSDNPNYQLDEVVYWPVFLVPFFVIPYAVHAVRGEKDRDTLDLLQTTLLDSWKILWGKVRAGMRLFAWRFIAFYGFMFILAIALFGEPLKPFVLFSENERNNPLNLFLAIACLGFVWSFFYISVGLFFSAFSNKTTTAYVKTVLFVFFFLFPDFILTFLDIHDSSGIRNPNQRSADASQFFYDLSPIYLTEVFLTHGWRNRTLISWNWFQYCCQQAFWLLLMSFCFLGLAEQRLRRME